MDAAPAATTAMSWSSHAAADLDLHRITVLP
jgi:hypothetical protein